MGFNDGFQAGSHYTIGYTYISSTENTYWCPNGAGPEEFEP